MILVFGLLATIAYAKSFTDVLGESLGLINDFFRNEGYKPYALAIDFFVFFAVFLAIYMRGIKFAFKEVNKTEKGLAIVLALTTAFLLVLGGYSIEKLLPFLQYFLFFLLFALIWWLLKDMKSKWLRFLLALLLALLLLLIFFGLFSATSYNVGCPESALPWLPWLLALLLFILFWFLLKDIKNALGRFLLGLLLTTAVVLLILFLLSIFSKNLGCPEGPFATSFFGDMSDSFKRMDIGTFSGFGGFGSSLPTLPQISPPDQKKDETGKTVAPEAQRPFKIYKDEELQQFLKDPRTQTPTIKQKLEEEINIRAAEKAKRPFGDLSEAEIKKRMGEITFSADRARLQEELDERSRQRREKSATDIGLIFEVPRGDKTLEVYERELLNQKGQHKDSTYYVEKEDNKVILKKYRGWWWDAKVDPETDDDLKGLLKAKKGEHQEERGKTADSLGLFFGVPSAGKTLFQREEEIISKGMKAGTDGSNYYTERDQEGKIILKREEWFTDPVVPLEEPGVKSIIDQERTKQRPAAPPAPAAPVAPAPSATTSAPKTAPPATTESPRIITPIPPPSPVPTPPPATQEKTPPPATPSAAKPAGERKGLSTQVLMGIATLLALALGGGALWFRRGRPRIRPPPDLFNQGGFLGYPIDKIAQAIKEFEVIIALIESTQNEKDKFVLLGEYQQKLLEGLEKASAANLWTDKGREVIKDEIPILHNLLQKEEKLRKHLFELRTAESLFLENLDSWKRIVPQDYFDYLKNLVSKNAKPSEFKKMGIIQLASVLDSFEKQDEASIEELDALMKVRKIGHLVRGKFKTVKADWDKLRKYNTHENVILSLMIAKVKRQKDVLTALEKRMLQPKEKKSSNKPEQEFAAHKTK